MGLKFTKTPHLGFVWMHTINFTTSLSCERKINDMAWLVHEVVHISQYNCLGIQYIFEALIAQYIGGYSYGGIEELKKNNKLNFYNLEQQADIIKHAYLSKSNNSCSYKTNLYNLINQEF